MKHMRPALWMLLAAAVSCTSEINEVDVMNTPVVKGTAIAPLTDESGTTRAYIGTEVTVPGFNLDRIARVEVAETEAEITEQGIKQLKFRIPTIELAQRDNPWPVDLNIYDNDGQVVYRSLYYVTKPVTDALVSGYAPTEGTLGTEITVSGRNLGQVTRVRFGGVTIEAADFSDAAGDGSAFKFLVPAGSYAAGDSEVAIAAEWGAQTIDVTAETPFTMHTPAFDAAAQQESAASAIGDEIELTGRNLGLVGKVLWGDVELLIAEQSAERLLVRIPSSIASTEQPAVASAALTARWGEPEQTVTVAAAWRVDRTPLGPAAPVVQSMTAEDGGADNRFYLGKVVTVKGENLATVEGFLVDGVKADLAGEPTDVEARFVVPAGVAFTEAGEVAVKALYNDGEQVDAGTAKVYPFYYYPNITLGAQDAANRDKAFFVPALGRVLGTDEFMAANGGRGLDPYIAGDVMSSGNKLNKAVIASAAQYHEVPAYIFITTSSAGKMSFISPSNSATQIKSFSTTDGTALPSGYGTPVMGYRQLNFSGNTEIEQTTEAKALAGELASVSDLLPRIVSSGAPSFDNAGTANNTFKAGQVLLVQHMSYEAGAFASKKPEDVYDGGILIVRSVTDCDGAAAQKSSTITFDLYWTAPRMTE